MTAGSTADTAAVAEEVRDARSRGESLRIVGAGTWLDAGPLSSLRVSQTELSSRAKSRDLHLTPLTGIVEYEPGDLVLTARAGTSLAEIERTTAPEGQWLTLDPFGSESGTIGATMATASSGPLASAFGTTRDHILGCEFVAGTGDIVRTGGRVVKNVAGFDLVRMVTGAWGTLGVLTEITVRLRARPAIDRTFAVAVAGDTPAAVADAAWRFLRATEYSPLAAELLSPSLARALGLEPSAGFLVRFGGSETFVSAAIAAAKQLGVASEVPGSIWRGLSDAEPAGATVFRLSSLPSRIGDSWGRVLGLIEPFGGFAHASASRGVVRCMLPAGAGLVSFSALGEHATIVGERMPAELWNAIATPRSSDALSHGIRKTFDPDGILNPGLSP
ncbi:MAG: FAD-binding protein [Gemmatimonadota bacterium]